MDEPLCFRYAYLDRIAALLLACGPNFCLGSLAITCPCDKLTRANPGVEFAYGFSCLPLNSLFIAWACLGVMVGWAVGQNLLKSSAVRLPASPASRLSAV
jgi:hypothetical protein